MRKPLDLWRASRTPANVFSDIDNMFDRYVRSFLDNDFRAMVPPIDVEETGDHYLVSVDLPGVTKDEINVRVQDNIVTISGERKREVKEEGRPTERSYGRFERSISLPSSIDPDQVEAHYENGVLELAIQKAESAKARQITIQSGKKSLPKSENKELKEAKKIEKAS